MEPQGIGPQLLQMTENNRQLNQQAVARNQQTKHRMEEMANQAIEQCIREQLRAVEIGAHNLIDVKA
ncbi:MAG: hypothetical protein AB7U30_10775 [Sulfuricellaceae bacterium]|jgi:DNA-binding protein H-NS